MVAIVASFDGWSGLRRRSGALGEGRLLHARGRPRGRLCGYTAGGRWRCRRARAGRSAFSRCCSPMRTAFTTITASMTGVGAALQLLVKGASSPGRRAQHAGGEASGAATERSFTASCADRARDRDRAKTEQGRILALYLSSRLWRQPRGCAPLACLFRKERAPDAARRRFWSRCAIAEQRARRPSMLRAMPATGCSIASRCRVVPLDEVARRSTSRCGRRKPMRYWPTR